MMSDYKNNIVRITTLVLALVTLSGCAATGVWLRDVEQPLKFNQPQAALQSLEVQGIQESDPALYLVHKGILQRMSGDIAGSIETFEAAKPLITFQEATSISELAANLTLTEGSGNYQPPAFEQIQLHMMQALNRLDMADYEAARIEATQIDILLDRRWEGLAPFGGDAAARYLTGVIYEANDEPDNALVAYRKALAAYNESTTVSVPEDLKVRLLHLTRANGLHDEYDRFAAEFGSSLVSKAASLTKRLANGDGELVFIAATGLVPHRYENSLMEQDPMSGRVYRISLPGLSARHDAVSRIEVSYRDFRTVSEPLDDLGVVAERTLDDEMPGLLAKAIARNVAKNVAANEIAEQNAIAGMFANFLSAASESADVRSWSTLPARFHLVRFPIASGEHRNFTIEYHAANGGHAGSETLGKIVILKNKPTIVGLHRSGH
jgi:hypothetical protein